MIPNDHISDWAKIVKWRLRWQVEQDLIICRAIIAIFLDPLLRRELRLRGGTALNKLHFLWAYRYSEDIDLVRAFSGPVGPILDRLRAVLEPWLGPARYDQSQLGPKLRFRIKAEDGSTILRLKVEINTRETVAYDSPASLPFAVSNGWFSGEAEVSAFSLEETLSTKLLALLQRNKARDLFDLAHALQNFPDLDVGRVVELFHLYLALHGNAISRAQAQDRMFAKLLDPKFMLDIRPLLPKDGADRLDEAAKMEAFRLVLSEFVELLPGDPWVKTPAMQDRFGIFW